MHDLEGTKEYWSAQTKKGDNPCHYHDQWQDAYAFMVRTGAFRSSDFRGVGQVVDVGCGVGDYMFALSEKAAQSKFIGFDFPFNIEIARRKYADHSRLAFRDQPLPSREVADAIRNADAVVTTTVYVHLSGAARQFFLEALGAMRQNGKVFLLEYAPDVVPEFQKNLAHKEVETPAEIIAKLSAQGFEHLETRPVNYVDSFFFFHLGKNAFTYYLTLLSENVLRTIHFPRSKYKLLIFRKT
jgi:2-polyprenyl-3-methyl-5-hydroxy-6-metoxy-1,4-benzoquinol methylase